MREYLAQFNVEGLHQRREKELAERRRMLERNFDRETASLLDRLKYGGYASGAIHEYERKMREKGDRWLVIADEVEEKYADLGQQLLNKPAWPLDWRE